MSHLRSGSIASTLPQANVDAIDRRGILMISYLKGWCGWVSTQPTYYPLSTIHHPETVQ